MFKIAVESKRLSVTNAEEKLHHPTIVGYVIFLQHLLLTV